MRVVVTGASGKIGRVVCQTLLERGHDVLGVDVRPMGEPTPWATETADGSDYERMRSLVRGAEAVCHLGEIPHPQRSLRTVLYARNTATGSAVMLAAADEGVKAFVYASSAQVYGCWAAPVPAKFLPVTEDHPFIVTNLYAASKVANEAFLEGLVYRGAFASACAVRMPGVYPSRPPGWPPVQMTGPVQPDFGTWLHTKDAAALFANAAEKKPAGLHKVHGSASWLNTAEPIADRLRLHHPDWPQLPEGWGPDQTVIDFRKTAALLDWSPVHSDASPKPAGQVATSRSA